MMMYVCEECGMATHKNYGSDDIVLCDLCRDIFYEVCPTCEELTSDLHMFESRAEKDVYICEQCHNDGG